MKQKRQLIFLAVLVTVAAVIWWSYFRSEKTAVVTADMGNAAQKYVPIPVEDPKPRIEEIEKARKTEYKNVNNRNIFSREAAPQPAVIKDPKKVPDVVVPPVTVVEQPKVVPLPAKFFGFGTVPNGTVRLAFLTNGEEVYVIPEGELLQNRFRILRIGNTSLDYEDTSTSLRGTAPLEEQAAPSP